MSLHSYHIKVNTGHSKLMIKFIKRWTMTFRLSKSKNLRIWFENIFMLIKITQQWTNKLVTYIYPSKLIYTHTSQRFEDMSYRFEDIGPQTNIDSPGLTGLAGSKRSDPVYCRQHVSNLIQANPVKPVSVPTCWAGPNAAQSKGTEPVTVPSYKWLIHVLL